jgi:beta-galactosidase
MCARPGNAAVERMLVRRMLGKLRSPYACDGAIVYRLAAPQADHYFFIKDGPARTVVLDTGRLRYSAVTDPVTGQKLPLDAPVQVERYGGRWLRYEK